MSTGSVVPFTPTQPTQVVSVSTASQPITFNPCDAVLIYNAATTVIFVAVGTNQDAPTATAAAVGTPGSMPVPAGSLVLIGTPGITGGNSLESYAITKIAVIAGSSSGDVYITPGVGTQH